MLATTYQRIHLQLASSSGPVAGESENPLRVYVVMLQSEPEGRTRDAVGFASLLKFSACSYRYIGGGVASQDHPQS